jgi:hypothetical protein
MLPLAQRNLFHDNVRLTVTLTGIVFSVVLIVVQLGLFIGFTTATSNLIDQLWGGFVDHLEKRALAIARPCGCASTWMKPTSARCGCGRERTSRPMHAAEGSFGARGTRGAATGGKECAHGRADRESGHEILETLVEPDPGSRLPDGLRVDAFIVRNGQEVAENR